MLRAKCARAFRFGASDKWRYVITVSTRGCNQKRSRAAGRRDLRHVCGIPNLDVRQRCAAEKRKLRASGAKSREEPQINGATVADGGCRVVARAQLWIR